MDNLGTIRLAGIVPESYTDGEGIRFSIFVQGCSHNCKDCHNPETHDFNGGYIANISDIIEQINKNPLLDGITLTGGDPLYQVESSMKLAKYIKENTDMNVWCYTGFTFEQILNSKDMMKLMEYIDVLVDGMYDCNKRSLSLPFRGSSNQRIIDVKEYMKTGKIIEIQFS